jgi:hypothetical protein
VSTQGLADIFDSGPDLVEVRGLACLEVAYFRQFPAVGQFAFQLYLT